MARAIDLQRKAKRRGQWLRLAISGPQSSGKTRTSLWVAFQLGNRVLFIDTEVSGPPEAPGETPQGAAELFAEHFEPFTHHLWEPPFAPDELAATLLEQAANFDVIVVDSGSHFWRGSGGTLSIVDDAFKSGRYGKHQGAGWAEGTPIQDELVDALQQTRCHVIFAMRSKVEWDMSTMTEVGIGAVQRKGLEYEFTVGVTLDRDWSMTVNKSRVDAGGVQILPGAVYKFKQHGAFMSDIRAWLGSAEALPTDASVSEADQQTIMELMDGLPEGRPRNVMKQEFLAAWGLPSDLTEVKAKGALRWCREYLDNAEDDPDPQPSPEPEPEPDPDPDPEPVEPHKAKKAARPASKKASTPRGGTRKGPAKKGARKTGTAKRPGSGASETQEKAQEPKPVTPPEPVEGLPGGYEPVEVREFLSSTFVSVDGQRGLQMENSLVDAGLWPIDQIEDGDLKKAAAIVTAIAEGENE